MTPAVVLQCAQAQQAAEALASQLGIDVQTTIPSEHFAVVYSGAGIALHAPLALKLQPLVVDFSSGKVKHRLRAGQGLRQPLARALGATPKRLPVVLDATAGLGSDAFVMASMGCTVMLLERHPVVARLLADGLQRAKADAEVAAVVSRMHFQQADATNLSPKDLPQAADVVYLDPMYAENPKRRLPGKAMQYFRALIGGDADVETLWAQAQILASNRVVVKRSRKDGWLTAAAPSHSVEGKTTRYDVYLNNKI